MSGLRLRSGPSGKAFTGTPGNVLTVDPSGDTWSAKPGATGGLVSFNGRTTPAAVPAANDYAASQVNNDSSVAGTGVKGALNTLLADIAALQNAEHGNGNSGATITVDVSTGDSQNIILTANCTMTLTGIPAGVPSWTQFTVTQDATGGRTLAIVGAKTPGAAGLVLSVAPNAVDIVSVYVSSGGVVRAVVAGNDFR